MKTIPEILDQVKKKTGIKNDYNLALKLNLSPMSVFEFRNGKSIPADETCIKLANLGRESAEKIILIAHATRAKSKEATKIWNGILKKAIGFSIVILLLSPALSNSSAVNPLYIMRQMIFAMILIVLVTSTKTGGYTKLWKSWKELNPSPSF